MIHTKVYYTTTEGESQDGTNRNSGDSGRLRDARSRVITLIAAFYADKRSFEERLNKAYQDGVAKAEAKAAAVGGWDNWVAAELEKN